MWLNEYGKHGEEHDDEHPAGEPFERLGFARVIYESRVCKIEAVFFVGVFKVYEGFLRAFFDFSGIRENERHQDYVRYGKCEQSHRYAREHRYAHKVLRNAHRKGVDDACGKTETRGKHGYSETDKRVPAEGVTEQNDDGNERNEFLEHACRRAEEHKRKRKYEQQYVFARRELVAERLDHVDEHARIVKSREYRADNQQKRDERPHHERAVHIGVEDEEGRKNRLPPFEGRQ